MLAAALLLTIGAPTSVATIVRVVGSANEPIAAIGDVQQAAFEGQRWILDIQRIDAAGSANRLGEAIRACGANNDCVADLLVSRDVDRGVYVVANLLPDTALVSIEVIDSKSREVFARRVRSVARDELSTTVSGLVEEALVAAGHRLGGRLVVDVRPADATLTLTPSPDADLAAVVLEPGSYELGAVREGYVARAVTFDIASRETSQLELELEAETSILSTWWFWTAVGTVVVAGSAAAIVLSRGDPTDACHPIGGGSC